MINRFSTIAKRHWLKNECICQIEVSYYRRYTTSNESSNKKDYKPLDDLLDIDHFWELPESTSKKDTSMESTKTSFSNSNFLNILTNHNSKYKTNPNKTIDKLKEEDVLDDLTARLNQDIDNSNKQHQDNMEKSLKPKKRISSILEQQLRDLVLKKKHIYKNKSPLPKSFLHAVYDDNNNNNNNTMMEDKKKEKVIYHHHHHHH
ncbi:unnamed protein product [Cunninghamella blakesleeana]